MPEIELRVESGDTVSVHYEPGDTMHLVVGESQVELSRDDVSRLFAALVVARRSTWGFQ